jgi:hypothetical protein
MITEAEAPAVETTAPAAAPVIENKHTDAFAGREADEVEEFDSSGADRGDEATPETNSATEAAAAAQEAAEATAAEKAAKDAKDAQDAADLAAANAAKEDKAVISANAEKAAKGAKDAKDAAETAPDAAEAGDPPGDKNPRIPKERFDTVNNKRKAAEAENLRLKTELEALRNPPKVPDAFDFDAKEEAYMQAVLDGDTKAAKAIRTEIRAAEKAEYVATVETVATTRAQQTLTANTMQARTEAVVAELQGRFEIFDEASERYNEEAVNDTIAMQRGFIEQGMDPDKALTKAAGLMTKGETDRKAAPAVTPEEKPAAEVKPVPKKPDVAAKVKAANAQPPSLAKAGESGAARDGSVSVFDMPEEEFDALPDSKKRQLRGD